jgi:hypothetical protein
VPATPTIEITTAERFALDNLRPRVLEALHGDGCTQRWVAETAGVRLYAAGVLLRELGATKSGSRWLIASPQRRLRGERAWANPNVRSDW